MDSNILDQSLETHLTNFCFVKSPEITIPYDRKTLDKINELLAIGYHYDPLYKMGSQIWQALKQLEYQNFIDYPLPISWYDILKSVEPATGESTLKLLFPTNTFKYADLLTLFVPLDVNYDQFEAVLKSLMLQLLDPTKHSLTHTFAPESQSKILMQRTGLRQTMIDAINREK